MKKLFFGIEMKWWKVIVFAVIIGVYTGIIMQIHALDGTSFQDIGISYECWVLFAVILCMNCQKSWEAALKTFVFFLVSQPLVYLTMWPEYHCFPWHYYRFWGILTVLTLPGGFICWQVKRKNILSAVILSVACGLLGCLGVHYTVEIYRDTFPCGILSAAFCFAQIILLIFVLLPGKRERIIAGAITLAVTVAFTVNTLSAALGSSAFPLDGCNDCICTVEDESIISACPNGYDQIDITAYRAGETAVECTLTDGSTVTFSVTVEKNGNIILTEVAK